MNEELENLTAEQQLAREALKSLQAPTPDLGFRAQLKQAFVDGSIEAVVPAPVAVPARTTSGRSASLLDWLRGTLAGRLSWAAATAAIVLAVVTLNRGPAWELIAATGEGVAVVNGQTIPISDTEALTRVLTPGVRVRVPDGAVLELRSAKHLAVRLTPGTDATIPGIPGRWFGRTVKASVFTGIMRITTGVDFRGARLAIATPIADVELTGTTIAVICEPDGTCVCVLEGTVKIGEKGAEMGRVAEGQRRFIYNDGRPSVTAEIRAMESEKLTAFRNELRAQL